MSVYSLFNKSGLSSTSDVHPPAVDNGRKIAVTNSPSIPLLLAIVLLSSYAYFESGSIWNQDSHFDVTRALVEQHTMRIDSYQANTGDKAFCNGHFYCDKAPGLSLLAAPGWGLTRVLARAVGKDQNSYQITRLGRYLAGVITVSLPAAVALVLLFLEAVDWDHPLPGQLSPSLPWV